MTIGNIPKAIRRQVKQMGYMLVGYLPTDQFKHIKNQSLRRRRVANVFHGCMRFLTRLLQKAGAEGMEVVDGYGVRHRGHPILAAYIGDYPEQLLVTCVKKDRCPICTVPWQDINKCPTDPQHQHPIRSVVAALRALRHIVHGPTIFRKACESAGIKPVQRPFWEDLPYTNIWRSITPDVLHELYQGIIKHLLEWVIDIAGANEVDARFARMTPHHNTRVFVKGVSHLQRVTGREHSQIASVLLGVVVGLKSKDGGNLAPLVRCVRALMDFLQLALYPIHSDTTLLQMQDALTLFHRDKDIFVQYGVTNMLIVKLHKLGHYVLAIQQYGTTDNYNTEYSERLHIDYAKEAYRASNRKGEVYDQMVNWLGRQEKIMRHQRYIDWCIAGRPIDNVDAVQPQIVHRPLVTLSKHPTVAVVKIDTLVRDYGATNFHQAMKRYLAMLKSPIPYWNAMEVEEAAWYADLPFQDVQVRHRIKFWNRDPYGRVDVDDHWEIVHCKPSQRNRRGQDVPGRFDTVLCIMEDGEHTDLSSKHAVTARMANNWLELRVGQVRVFFSLSNTAKKHLIIANNKELPACLAYIDWFTPFRRPEPDHHMHKVSRSITHGERTNSIVNVKDLY